MKQTIQCKTEQETQQFAEQLAQYVPRKAYIALHGDLGTGKTTFVRAFIKALGCNDSVRSPTYTLLETYSVNAYHIVHMDLYRLSDPSELEFIGIYDYLGENALCLIEWPEKAGKALPIPDVSLHFFTRESNQREITITTQTTTGNDWVSSKCVVF